MIDICIYIYCIYGMVFMFCRCTVRYFKILKRNNLVAFVMYTHETFHTTTDGLLPFAS